VSMKRTDKYAMLIGSWRISIFSIRSVLAQDPDGTTSALDGGFVGRDGRLRKPEPADRQ
jgi:hypothetical protein